MEQYDIAMKWLREVYIPETQPKNRGEWRLLVLDEHANHMTKPFRAFPPQSAPPFPTFAHLAQNPASGSERGLGCEAVFSRARSQRGPYDASAPFLKQQFLRM
jgi:hypothetical protein